MISGNPPPTIGQMMSELWSRRRLLLTVMFAAGVLAAIVSLFLHPTYRATVLMAPPEKVTDSGGLAALAGQFSGLADLAGVNLGGGDVDQSMALMTSREFTDQFIQKEHVLEVMYPDEWDAAGKRWKTGGEAHGFAAAVAWLTGKLGTQSASPVRSAGGGPSLWVAYKKFDSLRKISKDKKTNLITLTVDWRDPVTAARWANDLVSQLNLLARARATDSADRSIAFLQKEVAETHVLEMEQTIYRLIEREMRTKVSANVHDEYAFRVLDPAVPPEERESPKRALITLAVMMIAGFFTSLWIIFGPRKELVPAAAHRAAPGAEPAGAPADRAR
jgi:uncharacterized protein involved in exopolysaccharide biosynthesis